MTELLCMIGAAVVSVAVVYGVIRIGAAVDGRKW